MKTKKSVKRKKKSVDMNEEKEKWRKDEWRKNDVRKSKEKILVVCVKRNKEKEK